MEIEDLRAKAEAIGFSFQKGSRRGAGYVLTDANGDKPLGADYSASLADIAQHLENALRDHGEDDVEVGSDDPTKPPSASQIKKALVGHPQRAEIAKTLDAPFVENMLTNKGASADGDMAVGALNKPKKTKAEKLAEDRLYGTPNAGGSLIWTRGQNLAFDWSVYVSADGIAYHDNIPGGMSPDDRRRMSENSRRANAEQDHIDSAAARKQEPQWFRVADETKISIDDPLHPEKARKRRAFREADQKLYRTNISSKADIYYDDNNFFRTEIENDEEEYALPPADGPSGGAKASTGFAVETKRDAVAAVGVEHQRDAKAEGGLVSLKRAADARFLSEAAAKCNAANASKDRAAAGSVLQRVKDIVGHGKFTLWLVQAGIHKRTAERCLRAAKSDTDPTKSDTASTF
jgi:hypothetical protein